MIELCLMCTYAHDCIVHHSPIKIIKPLLLYCCFDCPAMAAIAPKANAPRCTVVSRVPTTPIEMTRAASQSAVNTLKEELQELRNENLDLRIMVYELRSDVDALKEEMKKKKRRESESSDHSSSYS